MVIYNNETKELEIDFKLSLGKAAIIIGSVIVLGIILILI